MNGNPRHHESREDGLTSFKPLVWPEASKQGSSYARPLAADLIAIGYKYGLLENRDELTPEEFYERITLLKDELSGRPDTVIDLMRVLHHGISGPPVPPPLLGERLLYLVLSKEERENLIGDLAEEYAGLLVRHGIKFAKVWYWKQVCGSLPSLVPRAIRWGLFASVVEWVRRYI